MSVSADNLDPSYFVDSVQKKSDITECSVTARFDGQKWEVGQLVAGSCQ
jgi:hypothetical protein